MGKDTFALVGTDKYDLLKEMGISRRGCATMWSKEKNGAS